MFLGVAMVKPMSGVHKWDSCPKGFGGTLTGEVDRLPQTLGPQQLVIAHRLGLAPHGATVI